MSDIVRCGLAIAVVIIVMGGGICITLSDLIRAVERIAEALEKEHKQ